jgi:hypothetical protein
MAHDDGMREATLNASERELLEMLRARRWTIGKPTREEQDLIVPVEFEDQEGSVRVLYATEPDHGERVGAWDEATAMLQSGGLFDRIERGAVVELLGIPVLGKVDAGRALRQWPMRQERAKAASSRHALRAEVTVARINLPKNTLELCRIVPEAYMSIGFIGSAAQLSALPPWTRTRRKDGCRHYIFTLEEVETGLAFAWLTKAIAPREGGAYRALP